MNGGADRACPLRSVLLGQSNGAEQTAGSKIILATFLVDVKRRVTIKLSIKNDR
jgi:hypothetical protein